MTRILTVDDSRAVRTIIGKTLRTQFEILEAEDGEKGLGVLSEETVDLVLLDVTMPVMDGPEMLKRMRERGDKTPVILLTAESKTSLIGGMMQLGINDYILKPFKPDELMAKITKVLGPQMPEAPAAAVQNLGPTPAAGKPFVDVLMIDDMENVAKKFRSMMPKHIKVNNVMDGQSALAACRERVFRTIVVDMQIPDVNSVALTSQLRVLQPTAAFLALYMRSADNPAKEARDNGFDGFLIKPFDPAQVNDFLSQYYDAQDLLTLEDNVMTLSSFPDSKERRAHYVGRLMSLASEAIEKCAAACYEDVIMDLTVTPPEETLPKILIGAQKKCSAVGLTLRIVGDETVGQTLSGLSETADIPVYPTIKEAIDSAE
jgi:DNA-binding response OmpR family regulator